MYRAINVTELGLPGPVAACVDRTFRERFRGTGTRSDNRDGGSPEDEPYRLSRAKSAVLSRRDQLCPLSYCHNPELVRPLSGMPRMTLERGFPILWIPGRMFFRGSIVRRRALLHEGLPRWRMRPEAGIPREARHQRPFRNGSRRSGEIS